MYTITIKEYNGWYDCKIGCQHHFFLTVEGMMAELTEYMQDPIRVEERWKRFRESTRQESMPIPENAGIDPEEVRRARTEPQWPNTTGSGFLSPYRGWGYWG